MAFPSRRVLLAALASTTLLAAGVAAPVVASAVSPAASVVDAWPSLKQGGIGNKGSLEATIKLGNCSAAWVRFPGQGVQDKAIMLTNGHCLQSPLIKMGVVQQNVPSRIGGNLLDKDGKGVFKISGGTILYGTMTGTDAAFVELPNTHDEIRSKVGFDPLAIAAAPPAIGEPINVPSGYWTTVYQCEMEQTIHRIKEGEYVWRDSLRYKLDNSRCKTKGGTSGSPVVSMRSGEVVGVNNTRADGGRDCAMNNPCEVDANGQQKMMPNYAYGQNTHWVLGCLTPAFKVDVNTPGCKLSKNGDRE